MIKVAINGFGRIGRITLRTVILNYSDQVEVVAINTSGSMDIAGWAHLFRYDTVYGKFEKEVSFIKTKGGKNQIGELTIYGKSYPVLAQRIPGKIPWGEYEPDVVLESTGVFRNSKDCQGHLKAGAKRVIISAPVKDQTPTYLIGVNADHYKGEKIVSNASCTTNCIAPVAKIMKENFKTTGATMTTIHAYTSSQQLVDNSHNDLRRARAAASNIVPTSTGAAKALMRVLPGFEGKFDGLAVRVPVVAGSLSDMVFVLDHSVRKEKVNRVFDEAAAGVYHGIIEVTNKPLVSSDIIGSCASAVVDLSLTSVLGGNLVKIIAWYDNEWGYACRLVELAALIGEK